ncbi:UNVERIFIED_CONTAM: hypothetical protein GTU68_049946 [Idotea baltica]|nr:hypothetical protein [Idotea baltica]
MEKTQDFLSFDQVVSPLMDENDVPSLVQRCYGLKTVYVKKLNGYDDKNYYIKVGQESENPHLKKTAKNGYILKVLNSETSKQQAIIEGQNSIMHFLSKNEVCVPMAQKDVNGQFLSKQVITSKCTEMHKTSPENIVRLFSYIPGKLMMEVTYTKQLLFEVGQITGKIDNVLKNFSNASIRNRTYMWQLQYVPQIVKYLHAVEEEQKQKLIKEVLSSWDSLVEPAIPLLEKGFIHGDLNEQNILVEADNQNPSLSHICGILDFGDVSYSPLIFELAITITYVVLEVNSIDSNEAAGYVIAGYETERKVTDVEWNILRECVAARMAQSLVLGAFSYTLNPGNEYVLCTAKKGWQRLAKLWSAPKEQLIANWKDFSNWSFEPNASV